ncbi:transcription initiation factor TFIID subunit [Heterostelium album PN500]|uniref:Transcription initiation factor TFIID subunit 5 n=1 Tax=Heterostelium pallidum (strain ATCC 26659 / Pp 5 / PN500) TaxID=670386 RepID=D3BRV0_HETP5|nr:transcription initiation factor TFIID subunit [Heterostelium album PN500]EFA76132.1 transcription initiation factor TFIID subunit [Heterostelium album PN500]|eukprot:XP_020428266.1 transcription initiation factor TFIID subunit [Heterostelium album PN500]
MSSKDKEKEKDKDKDASQSNGHHLKEKEIDLAVLEYLKKRGYSNSENIFKQESNVVDIRRGETASIELDQSNIAQYLLFYNQQEYLNPQKYLESYEKLRNWIHLSLDIYKQEFLSILYPIFVHCYIDLISKGYPNEAFELMEKLGPEHEDFYDDDLKLLRVTNTRPGLIDDESLSGQSEIDTSGVNSTPIMTGLFKTEEDEDSVEDEKKKLKKKKTREDAERMSRSKSNVPLPKFSDAFETELNNDISRCVTLSSSSLPSICCYTFFNTYQGLNSVEISKDASIVVGGFDDSSIRMWNLKEIAERNSNSGSGTKDNVGGGGGVESTSASTGTNASLSLSASTTSTASSMPTGKSTFTQQKMDSEFRTFIGHCGPVYGCSISPDNQFIMSCSEDNTARLWSLETMSNLVCYKGHNYPIWDVNFSPYGYYFATASHDKTARLWCTNYISPMRIFAGHLSDVNCVKFHPNINYVATGSSDKSARLWECHTGKCVRIFMGHRAPIYSVSISPDGKYLATAGEDTSIILWDLGSGKKIKKMDGHNKTIYSLDFSMDGSILASASADCTVRLWDVNAASSTSTNTNIEDTVSKTPSKKARLKQKRISPELLETYPTKQTPVFNVTFSRRNLLLSSGPYQIEKSLF